MKLFNRGKFLCIYEFRCPRCNKLIEYICELPKPKSYCNISCGCGNAICNFEKLESYDKVDFNKKQAQKIMRYILLAYPKTSIQTYVKAVQ